MRTWVVKIYEEYISECWRFPEAMLKNPGLYVPLCNSESKNKREVEDKNEILKSDKFQR